ncbi:MAG: ABC transporter ATP-binding protein [Pseudomonadota bacterium]|nr:ABC transporter ATP-binding protein [Pseudomonadota bacterium]
MISVAKKLISFLDGRARVTLYILLVPRFIVAALEMISIGMVIPLLQVAMSGQQAPFLNLIPNISNELNVSNLIAIVGFLFVVFFIIKNIFILATIYLITRFTQKNLALFSQRMFNLYLRRNYVFYLDKNSADIIRNLSNSAGACFDGLRLLLTILMDTLLALGAMILLLIVETSVTLLVGSFLTLAAFGLYRGLGPFLHAWGGKAYFFESKVIQSINQGLGAIKDIKVLNCHDNILASFISQTNNLAKFATRSITANQSPRLFIETLVVIICVILVIVLVDHYNSIDKVVETLGLFGMAALRLMPSMNRILGSAAELRHRTTMVDSLYSDLLEGEQELAIQEKNRVSPPLKFEKEIALAGISYSYPNSQSLVLNNISATISKGSSIGLVGESGSGKTTLADTLLGLIKPDEGELLIDGKNAFDNITGWQCHMGYVPQEVYLFDDTLLNNIAFGVLYDSIDYKAVGRATRMAQLDTVIDDLPNGHNTMLGERGVRLSGGQCQRVGIARALYRDPDVLVLDEATSSLDSKTEWEVSNAIEAFSGVKTLIIIAHRLSTLAKCDQLIFLKEGKIIDRGSYDELVKRCPEFARLVEIQQRECQK